MRKKKQTPSSTTPSLQVTKEKEFDRILLLVLNRFLTDKGIPEEFLKSTYFTLGPQLVQLYQEVPTFRTRLEEALDRVGEEVVRDYKMLVNETNRTNLSQYTIRRSGARTWDTTIGQRVLGFKEQTGHHQAALSDR